MSNFESILKIYVPANAWVKPFKLEVLFKPFKLEVLFRDKEAVAPYLDNNLEHCDKYRELSIAGEFDGSYGQIVDTFSETYPDDRDIQRLANIWQEWHLLGMKAGTKVQMDALKEDRKNNPNRKFPEEIKSYDWYGQSCYILKELNLYSDRGYTFGKAWLSEKLPDGLEQEVKDILERLKKRYSRTNVIKQLKI